MSGPKGFAVIKNKWSPKTGDIVRKVKDGSEFVVTMSSQSVETCSCVCIKSAGTTTAGLSYFIMKKELAPVPPATESLCYSQGQFVQLTSPPYAVGVVVYRANSLDLDVLFADGIEQVPPEAVVPFRGTLSVGGDNNV